MTVPRHRSPEPCRRRPKRRRLGSDLSYGWWFGELRAPGSSSCSSASKGPDGRQRGGREQRRRRARRRPEFGVGEDDAAVHGRRSWCMRSAPESMVSRRVLLGRAEELGSAGLAGHGDGRSSVSRGRRLTGENGGGEKGGRSRSSQRVRGGGQQARGRSGGGESCDGGRRMQRTRTTA